MPELDIKYLNELIDFVVKNIEKAYSLYKTSKDEDREQLEKIYSEICEKINAYSKHYQEADEDINNGFLTAWLYKYDNDSKLNEIDEFLTNSAATATKAQEE